MRGITSERLAIGLLFVVIAALACFAPTQSDTWWHLRAGQDIWRTHHVSLVDSYSYTAAGSFFPNHEWLTEVIFYAAYWLGGLPLLTGLCAAAITLAWAVSWRLTEGSFETRFLLFAASLATAAAAWAVRPQALSMALFSITCALLVSNRLRWLPVLFVVWTNLHGAVALGVVAVCAALFATVVIRRHIPKALGCVTIGCMGATFVSPLGVRLWTEIPKSIERSRVDQLIEWQPPDLSPGFWAFWGITAALLIALVVWRRRLDERSLKLATISIAMLPLAVSSRRNVAIFLLVAVPALTALARRRDRQPRAPRVSGERPGINAALLSAAVVIAAAVVALGWMAPAPALGWQPIRRNAIDAIKGCGEPLYNTYGDGGVLIWFLPQRKVFLDNRQDPYPLDLLVVAHQLELDGKYEQVFRRYGIRCAVVPTGSVTSQGLTTAADWTKRYSDERWTVFVRGI
jgi:hypothetical protein